MRLEHDRICRSPGGLIPPREGRVRAASAFTCVFNALWRGGGERAAFVTGFAPPGAGGSPPPPRGGGGPRPGGGARGPPIYATPKGRNY